MKMRILFVIFAFVALFSGTVSSEDIANMRIQTYVHGQHLYGFQSEHCIAPDHEKYMQKVFDKLEKDTGVEILVFAWDANGRDIKSIAEVQYVVNYRVLGPVSGTKRVIFFFAFNTKFNGKMIPFTYYNFDQKRFSVSRTKVTKAIIRRRIMLSSVPTFDEYIMSVVDGWFDVFKETYGN